MRGGGRLPPAADTLVAVTADDFRELVLGLDGAIEGAHMGHPDFRATGRIFASLQADDQHATLKLAPDEQRALLASHPDVFSPAAGAWGRQGWTRVRLAVATRTIVRPAVLLAWQHLFDPRPTRPGTRNARGSPAPRRAPGPVRSTRRRG